MSEIVVIYDGQCELCKNSIAWVQKKLSVTALDFHSANLANFGLSKEQCSREVFVITQDKRTGGSEAIAVLLKARGNKVLSNLISISGPLSRKSYKWVAANRNSFLVKVLSDVLKRSATRFRD